MNSLIITGNGTDVGKTVVSAIIATMLKADYWKPIQCGDIASSDSMTIRHLLHPGKHCIHPSAYSFKAPLSPHHAARIEGVVIQPQAITPPETDRLLVIETIGGLLVPLTTRFVCFDLFSSWKSPWIVVSRNYLGSINHTLLTIDTLKRNGAHILGLIFNGEPNLDSESAITEISALPMIGRLYPEPTISIETIERYANLWQSKFKRIVQASGTPFLRCN